MMDPGGGEFDPRPDLSGSWETYAVDNQEPFLRAFGSAFHTGIPAVVRPKELHVLRTTATGARWRTRSCWATPRW